MNLSSALTLFTALSSTAFAVDGIDTTKNRNLRTGANNDNNNNSNLFRKGPPSPKKVDICHYQEDEGVWKKINISEEALLSHMENHDDGMPGGVTSGSGILLDDDCVTQPPTMQPSLNPSESLSPSDVPSTSTKPSLSPSDVPSTSTKPSTSAAPSCLLPSLATVTSITPVPIPVFGSVSVTLNVGNESDECIIEDVDITVGIDNTFAGDLELALSSPGGAGTAILTDNQGGSSDFVSSNLLTFDDASLQNPNNIGSTNPIQAGTFFSRGDGSGNNKLSGFAGGSPPGDWIFTVTDTFNGCPIGTIDSVTLRITSICPCELEPSLTPSTSGVPSVSNVPSVQPSISALPSSPPSTSLVPSVVPSVQPSVSMIPSEVPSPVPSIQPSVSMIPSEVPSPVPSIQPSVSMIPSVVPSISTQPSSSSAPVLCDVEIISPVETLNFEGQQLTFAFTNLEAAFDNVQVEVNTRGDLGLLAEFYTITAEGGSVSVGNAGDTGTNSNVFDCNTAFNVDTFTITEADFNGYIGGDGTLTIEANPSLEVNTFCSFDEVFVKLSYSACV